MRRSLSITELCPMTTLSHNRKATPLNHSDDDDEEEDDDDDDEEEEEGEDDEEEKEEEDEAKLRQARVKLDKDW